MNARRTRLVIGVSFLAAALAIAIMWPSTLLDLACLQSKTTPFGQGCPRVDHHYIGRTVLVLGGAAIGSVIAFGLPSSTVVSALYRRLSAR